MPNYYIILPALVPCSFHFSSPFPYYLLFLNSMLPEAQLHRKRNPDLTS